jgi:hypothetical protein
LAGGSDWSIHDRLPLRWTEDLKKTKKNRRDPAVFGDSAAFSGAYARISLPPEALENQK